jgi:NADPH-dependent 2,4-dienoyl-CoA reductase/sulfur reductase-like enzyme
MSAFGVKADLLRESAFAVAQALNVSPRIGHLHVAVDGAQWVWADTSGGPIIIAGLPPGPHKAEITLVNANHQPLDRSAVVEFVVPAK